MITIKQIEPKELTSFILKHVPVIFGQDIMLRFANTLVRYDPKEAEEILKELKDTEKIVLYPQTLSENAQKDLVILKEMFVNSIMIGDDTSIIYKYLYLFRQNDYQTKLILPQLEEQVVRYISDNCDQDNYSTYYKMLRFWLLFPNAVHNHQKIYEMINFLE